MGKQKRGKSAQVSSKTSRPPYELILGIIAVVAAVAIYFYSSSGGSTSTDAAQQQFGVEVPSDYLARNPTLRNRLILPAIPHETRPITLPPESFTDDEVRRSYQAAKDYPEVLETVACYCGCYREAGHRNNLDCYKDNHGIT
jgi:hypothetical protein